MSDQPENLQGDDTIRTAWRLLESRPDIPGQLRAFPLDVLKDGASATINSEGSRGILLFLKAAEQVSIPRALRPDNIGMIAAEVAGFGEQGSSKRAISVWCLDSRCDDAFAGFCGLFLRRVRAEPVTKALTECYEQFKRLFKEPEPTTGALIGVVGELLALKDVLELRSNALEVWAGPASGRHDLRLGDFAIEVKCSLRSSSKASKAQISDIDQLDRPIGGKLYLHAIRLERVAGGSVSVSRLVMEIEKILSPSEFGVFESMLASIGFGAPYDEKTFSVLSRSTYAIAEAFPRLTKDRLIAGALDPGVSTVTYEIDLETAASFLVPWEVAMSDLLSGGVCAD